MFVNWMMKPGKNITQVSNANRCANEIVRSERFMDATLLSDDAV